MLIIGLTGGIGSGKSTVARLLGDKGAVVIDVDQLGRDVLLPGGRAHDAVIDEFGRGIVGDDGYIDRAKLAAVVFNDPSALARLTAISHPAINAELADRLGELPSDAIVVLDMAVLVESQLGRADPAHSYRRVIVVETDIDTRVERAVARGMRAEDVRARINSQATDAERRAVADMIVRNDGALASLVTEIDRLWPTILDWSKSDL